MVSQVGGKHVFPERRASMEAMGEVYRRLKESFDPEAVGVYLIDPRDRIWLWWHATASALRHGAPWGDFLRALALAFPFPAVIINGRLAFSGEIPEPESVAEAVRAHLRSP